MCFAVASRSFENAKTRENARKRRKRAKTAKTGQPELSNFPTRFLALYPELPAEAKVRAKRAYKLVQRNPGHPGVNLKKIYSATVGSGYRALGEMDRRRSPARTHPSATSYTGLK